MSIYQRLSKAPLDGILCPRTSTYTSISPMAACASAWANLASQQLHVPRPLHPSGSTAHALRLLLAEVIPGFRRLGVSRFLGILRYDQVSPSSVESG